MEKEEQKKLLRLVYTLYEVDVIEDEARNRLVYFAMNNLTTPTQDKATFLKADLTINGIYQILGQFGEEHEPIKKKFREYCETLTNKTNQ